MCHSLQQPLGRRGHQLPSTHSPDNSTAHTQDTYTTSWFILTDLYSQAGTVKMFAHAWGKTFEKTAKCFHTIQQLSWWKTITSEQTLHVMCRVRKMIDLGLGYLVIRRTLTWHGEPTNDWVWFSLWSWRLPARTALGRLPRGGSTTLVEVLGQAGWPAHTHTGKQLGYMTCHQQPSSRLAIFSTSFESTQLVLSQNFLHTKDTFFF